MTIVEKQDAHVRRRRANTKRSVTTVLSTRLPLDLVMKLDERAESRGVNTSALIREILESAFVAASPSASLFG